MNAPVPYEPSADNRAFARMSYDLYMAMIQEGFSETQALGMLAQIVSITIHEQMGHSE